MSSRRFTIIPVATLLWACTPAPANEESSTGESETAGTTGTGTSETATESETGNGETTGDTAPDPEACWTDLSFGEAEVFAQGFSGGSEGIAFGVDGLLYVSSNDRVWQLDADGQASEFAMIPDAIGLAAVADGGLIVASLGMAAQPDGGVYAVDANATVTQILMSGIDSPNFVAITPDGSALISDDFDTRVFRLTPAGELSVVIESVPSPNGIAYSPDGAALFVASTFTPVGQLTRYEVGPDGLPIEATGVEILQLGMASTPDGIAVDEHGMVYVAANLRGQIWRVDGSLAELQAGEQVAEGLGFPASLAFGDGPGFDPCSLYVTQLQNDTVWRVYVGARGAHLYR